MTYKSNIEKYDLICVGGGIMSGTLALLTKLIAPELKIIIFERLADVAKESSAAINNAGTGHSALCELNYTPLENGKINISKALEIFKQFQTSKQFWTFLVENAFIEDPQSFIHSVPHHSWVTGKDNVAFLKKRVDALKSTVQFKEMLFTTDPKKMKEWFPLIMHGRTEEEPMAATRMDSGTEVNFGVLIKQIFSILEDQFGVEVKYEHEVLDIDPENPDWEVEVKDLTKNKILNYDAEHVFIGAGGGALPLLQNVEIDEKAGYGGFPVSGEWLFCQNEELIKKHHAKVYTKAKINAPPMSVPHLDTRYINGKQALMFGPFAGFSTKFLKRGSYLDLFESIRWDNIPSMWGAFWKNLDLTKYLIEQVSMTHEDRMNELREFIVDAKSDEWKLKHAGQRVQIIKQNAVTNDGELQFGTELVSNQKGTVTALLGASPGASTSVSIMLEVLNKAFPEIINSSKGYDRLNQIIPFYKKDIANYQDEFIELRKHMVQVLQLDS